MFQCNVCSKSYRHSWNMYRHRKSHKEYQPRVPYMCDYCGIQERNKKIFIQHIKEHDQNSKPRKIRLKCPECDDHLQNYRKLDEHIAQNHAIRIEEQYLEFKNEEEFYTWKLEVEKETQTQYIAERGVRKLKNFSQREYICNRSYNYDKRMNLVKPKKRSKSLGTNKIGAACPSRIIVKITGKKVMVNFTPVHVGHLNEVIRMRIPSHQRAAIAGKLRSGVTVQQVLDDIRDVSIKRCDNLERVNYIQRNDIHNIIRDYNIKYKADVHKDDVTSISLLIDTLRKQEDCPVLHYNSDFEDFCLIIMTPYQKCMLIEHPSKICVDRTHGLNANGYQLVSIVVIDEYNNGMPVAFCFTKKVDFAAIRLFYSKIKESIGSECDIKAEVFMSDDAPLFYDAWVSVFGTVDHKLLCWWHISMNWMKNLNAEIKDKGKRKIVKDTLYTLATEIQTEDEFETRLAKFLADLIADPLTIPFYNYFVSYYVAKKKSWALCFRKHIGLNTNMHLESLHKKIKHIYLDGRRCLPLDKAVNELFKLIRDSMYDHIIEFAKYCPPEKMMKIKRAHSEGVQIADEDVKCIERGKIWLLKSQTHNEPDYEVKLISNNCRCVLRCSQCEVCIHTYQCACPDNVIYLNICKHIHKIQIIENNENNESDNCANEVYNMSALVESHPDIIENEKENDCLDEELNAKLQLMTQFISIMERDEKEFISKKLDEMISKIKFSKKKQLN